MAQSGSPGATDGRDDARDVSAARAGDQRAVRALVERHQRALFGYCLVVARRDRERAVDLVQESFARALGALGTLSEPARFRSFLFSVAANLARSWGTREERQRRAFDAFELQLAEESADGPAPSPVAREQRIAVVQRLLGEVADPRLREVVQLKYGEPEHTTREIAERLGMPHGTVTVKLMRFRAAIRRQLCRALAEEGVEP